MRELGEKNGNSFNKLGLLKVIHTSISLTYLKPEHYVDIACNV